jgi:hypothetical protein
MDILARLERWQQSGAISPEQMTQLTSAAREEPFSVSLELNVLLYAGVLAFVGGLGWTVSTWSQQIGDVLVVGTLGIILAACFWYVFSRASAWSPKEQIVATPFFDYVLYLGCLVWGIELAYLERRFHLLSGQWDVYLLVTAALFFFLAYRFDNRLVLSLALSSLAGWFGVTVSHWPSTQDATYRMYAVAYCLVVGVGGWLCRLRELKAHFFGTYLNVVANVLFVAVLSGVFQAEGYGGWFMALLVVIGASLAWGITQRQFAFVAYAAVYGYVGVSSLLIRNAHEPTFILFYFVTTSIAMVIMLVAVARNFGRAE